MNWRSLITAGACAAAAAGIGVGGYALGHRDASPAQTDTSGQPTVPVVATGPIYEQPAGSVVKPAALRKRVSFDPVWLGAAFRGEPAREPAIPMPKGTYAISYGKTTQMTISISGSPSPQLISNPANAQRIVTPVGAAYKMPPVKGSDLQGWRIQLEGRDHPVLLITLPAATDPDSVLSHLTTIAAS